MGRRRVRRNLVPHAIHRRAVASPILLACAAILVSAIPALAACGEQEQRFFVGVHFVLDLGRGLADREHPVVVCNLIPNQTVRLTAVTLEGGKPYWSVADFHIADGELNTAKLAPTRGSYSGIHPDGYLWSMRRDDNPPDPPRRMNGYSSNEITVSIAGEKGQRLDASIRRDFGLVMERELRDDGLVGRLFVPDGGNRQRPAVIVLSGGDHSGFDDRMASLLASRGHVVLRLAYAGADGAPAQLQSVPIEYFSRAVDYLRGAYAGARGDIVVVAFGRATEAAAILALERDDIARIVLVSPSSVLNAGQEHGNPVERTAWTLHGAPLAFVRRAEGEDDAIARQQPPYKTRPRYDLRLAALADDDPARIPFDRIKSDVVLLACEGDDVWPSDRMANDILALARRHGRDNVTAQGFPGCGHDLAAPIGPTTRREYVGQDGVRYALGGTPEAVWYAQRAGWAAILKAIGSDDQR